MPLLLVTHGVGDKQRACEGGKEVIVGETSVKRVVEFHPVQVRKRVRVGEKKKHLLGVRLELFRWVRFCPLVGEIGVVPVGEILSAGG